MIWGWVGKQKKSKKLLRKTKIFLLAVFSALAPVSMAFADDINCDNFDTITITEADDSKGTVKGTIQGKNGGATAQEYDQYKIVVESQQPMATKSMSSTEDKKVLSTTISERQSDGTYTFEASGGFSHVSTWDVHGGSRVNEDTGWEISACILNKDTNLATCDFASGSNHGFFSFGILESGGDTATCSGLSLFDAARFSFPEDPADNPVPPNCLDDASGLFGWVSCPLLYTAADFITEIYENVVEDWLVLEPQLFTRSGEGQNVYEVWNFFRNMANAAIILLLLIIILSQISGIGISNYGIKKALPRLITAAILINLSYIVCQALIDLSNIIGHGLKLILEGELDSLQQISTADGAVPLGAGAIAFVVLLIGSVLTMIYINPALLLFALIALIVAMLAIIFLFVTMGIRQAMVILAVAVSPVAFACYVLPGTKSIYKKWFDLSKGLLLSYPIASLMVFGGALLGKIMVTVWGDGLLSFAGSLIITVAPFFFIPKTITASLGAVSKFVDAAKNNVTGFARNRMNRSGLAQDLRRSSDEKRTQRWAKMPGGAAYRRKADAITARHRRVDEYRNNPDLIRQEEALTKVRENEEHIDSRNETVQDMVNNLNTALNADASDDNTALITAYTNKLKESSEGRAQLANIFATRGSGPNALSDESFNAMMASFGADDIDELREVAPRMATYIEGVKNNTIGRGDYNTIDVFNSGMLDNLTEQSVANMDTAEFTDIVNQLTANPANRNSRQAVEFARIAENLMNNEKLAPSLNSQKINALTGTNGFLTQRNARIKATASSAFGGYASMNAATLNTTAQADYAAAAAAGDVERMEAIAYAFRNASVNRTSDAAVAGARTTIDGWANGARAAAQANGHLDAVNAQLDLISTPWHRIS